MTRVAVNAPLPPVEGSDPPLPPPPRPLLRASASAPGKIILFGEHSVVHGRPAIAASLSDLRIHVLVEARSDGLVSVSMPDLKSDDHPGGVSGTFDAGSMRLPWVDGAPRAGGEGGLPLPTAEDAARIRAALMDASVPPLPSSPAPRHGILDETALSALTPLTYLINVLVPSLLTSAPSSSDVGGGGGERVGEGEGKGRGISVTVQSADLPVGAGLGSSAAFGTSLAAALHRLRSLLRGEEEEEEEEEEEDSRSDDIDCGGGGRPRRRIRPRPDCCPSPPDLDEIDSLSFRSETLVHGSPSGIDNAVSCRGGAVYFVKDLSAGGAVRMESLDLPVLDMILTHTGVPRSTRGLVEAVGAFRAEFPGVVDRTFDAVGAIVDEFRRLVTSSSSTATRTTEEEVHRKVSKLIRANMHLLRMWGVSHPSLDAICAVTDSLYETTRCSTKLTGAGGGGCAFTFLERAKGESDSELRIRAERVRSAIKSRGNEEYGGGGGMGEWAFQCFESEVGGPGVLWTDPNEFPGSAVVGARGVPLASEAAAMPA